jgi:acetyl-CoA carboxylase carboxyltransferase component
MGPCAGRAASPISPRSATCSASGEVRRLFCYLPSNNRQRPPFLDLLDPPDRIDPVLDYLVPDDPHQTYNMNVLIYSILDGVEFMEVHEHFVRNIICGSGRLGSQTIGLVANQPAVLAGVLDNYAWPTAETAVMGTRGAAEIIVEHPVTELVNGIDLV